ncbi:MAG: sulfite exporter TauE/SafE family protein [Bacteroidota bacterium]
MLVVGFLIGLLGSLHCLGMCSPIALVMHSKGKGIRPLLYNIGRVITYIGLGALFGLIGEGISNFGLQGYLSILMGLLVLAIAVQPHLKAKLNNSKLYSKVLTPLRKRVLQSYGNQSAIAYLLTGLLNGLLPCGLVYMAMTASLASANIGDAMLLMAGFGMGTWPMMFAIGTAGKYLSTTLMRKINVTIPVIAVVLGVILIARGLSVDLPFTTTKAGITICR